MPDRSCSVANCERRLYGEDYCRTHRHRWLTYGDPLWIPLCTVEGCELELVTKYYCRSHYHRWKKTGDPLAVLQRDRTDVERFHTYVSVEPNGCWRWTGALNKFGYGKFWANKRTCAAHRFSYQEFVGEIPDGLEIDHFRFPQDGCIGPACVNSEHLRPVTPRENVLRSGSPCSMNRAKESCNRGHEFTPENTLIRPDGRRCRKCRRNDERRFRRAHRRS